MLLNLENVTVEKQTDFINSFDHVMFDMDGVVWKRYKAFPGSADCLNALKSLGKKITYITNNDFVSPKRLHTVLLANKINANCDEVQTPTLAIISYLKRIKFDKELYLVSNKTVRDDFEKAGFKLAPLPPQTIEETLPEFIDSIDDNENIGAVVLTVDLNMTLIKLQYALNYLKKKDCIWIVGPLDKYADIGDSRKFLGSYYYYSGLREIIGRDFIQMAKPSPPYVEYLIEVFNIKEPKRVLFVGDSIMTDVKTAKTAGFKSLLVLSGVTAIEDIENWTEAEDLKPDYYIQGLGSLSKIIKDFIKYEESRVD